MIGLLDCNNFFVSCERLFRPDLLKRPVAVLSSNDGCIVARSQEVKDLGIAMGVPYFQVKDICHKEQIVLFSSNFTLYRDVSRRVMEVLKAEVGPIEVYSIDESFFRLPSSTTRLELERLRSRIMVKTGIPVSIGAGATKTIAKYASKLAKKEGGALIMSQSSWEEATPSIPCHEIWNMGRQTSAKLRTVGIETVASLIDLPVREVRKLCGVAGERIQLELKGIIAQPLAEGERATPQSITSSRSFAKTLSDKGELESALSYHVAQCAEKLRRERLLAVQMGVYIKASRYSDFSHHGGYQKVVLTYPSASTELLTSLALKVLGEIFDHNVPYKKAGIVISDVIPDTFVSGSLFDVEANEGYKVIDTVRDTLNKKFGNGSIQVASLRTSGDQSGHKLRSKAYTTRWEDIPSVLAK